MEKGNKKTIVKNTINSPNLLRERENEREREYKTTNQKNEKIHMFNFVGEIDVSREYVHHHHHHLTHWNDSEQKDAHSNQPPRGGYGHCDNCKSPPPLPPK